MCSPSCSRWSLTVHAAVKRSDDVFTPEGRGPVSGLRTEAALGASPSLRAPLKAALLTTASSLATVTSASAAAALNPAAKSAEL